MSDAAPFLITDFDCMQIRYEHKWAFEDIQIGQSIGCFDLKGIVASRITGFKAYKGWDPVTGLGIPNYNRLKAFAMEAFKN